MMLVEALLAVAIGAGGGAGFLFQSGDMKTPAQVDLLQKDLDDTRRNIAERKEAVRRAEEERRLAEERARREAEAEKARLAEAQRLAEEERLRKEQEEKAKAVQAKAPPFGVFTIKAAADLNVEHAGERQRGKSVEFGFEQKPEKLKLRSGPFTIYLTPTVKGSRLVIDATVTPMAILSDGDQRNVGNLKGLNVGRAPVKLDVQSPAAGNLNLLLQYRK